MNTNSKTEIVIAGDDLWNTLYNSSANQVPFSSTGWRKSICAITNLQCDAVILMSDEGPLAGINMYYEKRGGRKFCKHPILTPYNTILLNRDFLKNDKPVQQSHLKHLLSFIRKNYIYPYFLADTFITDDDVFIEARFSARQGRTYMVDPITAVPDSDIRRRARKCMENGFYIRNEVNVAVFHELFHTTATRQGIKNVISKEQLQVLLDNCRDFTWGLTAYDKENVPHASWIQMNAGTVAYNWNAASNAELLSKGGTPFIVMMLLEQLKKDGFTSWDLCGADNPSVARFKASIGGVLTPYLKIDFSDYSLFDKLRFRFL